MAGCLTPEQWLRYLDTTASSPSREQVERHLDRCSGCRIVLAEAARDSFMVPGGTEAVPSARTLVVGETVGDRYEIRRFIAKGGMGEVYEAFDLVLHEVVALKTLTLAAIDQVDAFERMLTEVRAARRVTHANVCRQFEFGVHRSGVRDRENVPFLTMELMKGRTLAAALTADGPVPERRARQILRDIATGLSAIHAAGIVHRDLKSENVFLTLGADETTKAVVMDFGLALAPRTILGRDGVGPGDGEGIVGTLDYMSPEQIQGRPASPASDIYSFGIIAFELLTGQLPFPRSSSPRAAAQRLAQGTPRLPGPARKGRSWCDALLSQCLATDPALRPRTAGEIVALLDTAARPGRGAATVVVAGLIAVAALGLWKISRPSPIVARPSPIAQPVRLVTAEPAKPFPVPPPPSVPIPVATPAIPPPVKPRWQPARRIATHPTASPARSVAPVGSQSTQRASDDPLAPPRPHPRHADDLADPF